MTQIGAQALVIGSEGNIGTPLVQHLRVSGCEVLESDIRPAWRNRYVVADINHPIDLLPAFDWGLDSVFLLSAIVSRVTCEQASSLAISTNLAGINKVLQLARRVGAMAVFFSTSEVYGPHCDPMDEREPHPRPNNRYGLSKLPRSSSSNTEAHTRAARCLPPSLYGLRRERGSRSSPVGDDSVCRRAHARATHPGASK